MCVTLKQSLLLLLLLGRLGLLEGEKTRTSSRSNVVAALWKSERLDDERVSRAASSETIFFSRFFLQLKSLQRKSAFVLYTERENLPLWGQKIDGIFLAAHGGMVAGTSDDPLLQPPFVAATERREKRKDDDEGKSGFGERK